MNTTPLARAASREIPLRGYVIVLAGTVILAFTSIVIRILLTRYGMNPLTLAFWRVAIVTTFLFAALLSINSRHLRIAGRDLALFLAYGLIGVALHQLVWITSVQYNGAAVATVLVYTSPAIVAVFAWRFFREAMGWTKVLALVLTVLGCVLVARAYDLQQFQLNPLGLLAGLGSAFTFASYSLFGRLATRRYSAWTAIFYAFFFGTLFLLPVSLFTHEFVPLGLPPDGWGTLVFLALVPTLGGFGAFTVGLSHLPASVASMLSALEPVTTAIVAYFLFGEVLEPLQLLGAALILWAVVMLRPKNGGQANAK